MCIRDSTHTSTRDWLLQRAKTFSMSENNFDFLTNGKPTYWPTDPRKIPDVLDFFVTSGIPRSNCLVESCIEVSSDHTPVVANISTTIVNKLPPPKLTLRYTDWNKFQIYIEENINLKLRLKCPTDLDEAAQYITTLIQQIAWYSTLTSDNKTTNGTSIPLHIRQLIAEKRQAWSIWQSSRNVTDQHHYNKSWRELKKAIRNLRILNF